MNYFIYAIIIAAVLIGGWFLADSQGWLGDTATTTDQMATTSPWALDDENGTTTATSTTGVSATSPTSTGATSGPVKSFTVEGNNFKFSPATMAVKKGDRVRVTFKNVQGMHDFVIDEFNAKTQRLSGAGETETIEFVADKAGTFEYYCSVGTHRQMGMVGTLSVTE